MTLRGYRPNRAVLFMIDRIAPHAGIPVAMPDGTKYRLTIFDNASGQSILAYLEFIFTATINNDCMADNRLTAQTLITRYAESRDGTIG